MKEVHFAVFFLFVYVKVGQGTNITNSTNASIPTNSSINATTPLTTLYIGAFFDLGSKSGYGSLPMAEQAIEEINNNTDILPGYRLQLVVSSTQVSHWNVPVFESDSRGREGGGKEISFLLRACLSKLLFLSTELNSSDDHVPFRQYRQFSSPTVTQNCYQFQLKNGSDLR